MHHLPCRLSDRQFFLSLKSSTTVLSSDLRKRKCVTFTDRETHLVKFELKVALQASMRGGMFFVPRRRQACLTASELHQIFSKSTAASFIKTGSKCNTNCFIFFLRSVFAVYHREKTTKGMMVIMSECERLQIVEHMLMKDVDFLTLQTGNSYLSLIFPTL